MDKVMQPHLRVLYPFELCFKDREKAKLRSNLWNDADQRHVTIWIIYCQNTTENGDWCKSKDEIDFWLSTRTNGFIFVETKVNANLWKDSPIKMDEDDYFPLTTKTIEHNLKPIVVDSAKRDYGH